MPKVRRATIRDLLLTRRGVVFLSSTGKPLPEAQLRAVELEVGALGYVLSARLRSRLSLCSLDELVAFRVWVFDILLAESGGDQKHEPLFRRFPDGVPDDTLDLWWGKVLVHFLQADGQPCLFCRRIGTTHVLNPCRHVICDHCFDGANYSACPSCEHHVDRSSPFFKASPRPAVPSEKVTFKLLDLGENLQIAAKELFVSLCERKQALSPVDREALVVILGDYKAGALSWLPRTIPLKENIAVVFGTLFQHCNPAGVLPHARRCMTTATDLLRFIAVLSGTDGSLLKETVFKAIESVEGPSRFWGKISELLAGKIQGPRPWNVTVPLKVSRFKVAKMSRPLRRTILELMENLAPERLVEDMLRHRSYWVWVGEFLHPHEFKSRFPNVARAFHIVRKKSPDGTPAPSFEGWSGRLERTILKKDADAMVGVLAERPGEFARRFDHALRIAGNDDRALEHVLSAFAEHVPDFATPVLLTLSSHLPARLEKAGVRIYWPKGRVALGVSSADKRAVLPAKAIGQAVRCITAELLQRFATKPGFDECLVDEGLRTVIVPFNERTASASAVSLPRGSRIPVPTGKLIRLFLHWCQPEKGGETTDLDLSVALYDEAWRHIGVCSYYQLKMMGKGDTLIAASAGDLRDGPWPDGATEFVDLHCDAALSAGIRYAVLVINNYSGMPFSLLERGFAGMMLRDDPTGQHFDPRTVELRFKLNGENGVFLPLVLDMRENQLHWLDVQAKGQFEMNNVATSNQAITKLCPELMAYFASGVRPSMFDLALLHAAARSRRVFIRGKSIRQFVRRSGEDTSSFHSRLTRGEADEPRSQPPRADGPALLALLYRGDFDLPKGSTVYALFRERVAPSLSASDLLS